MSTIMDGDVEVGGDFARDVPKGVKHEIPVEAVEEPVEEAPEDAEVTEEGAEEHSEDTEAEDRPKKPTAKERIQELNRQKRDLERKLKEAEAASTASQLARIEKLLTGEIKLPNGATSDNVIQNTGAPDPTDSAKYPLGSLDDRFIQDLTDWKVDQRFKAAQQRQLEDARTAAEQAATTELLKKADEVVQKGSQSYEDYQEVVWDAGRRGDYDMDRPTFEAILEAEHGADIAYALASDKAEAARVARLTPFGQIQWVAKKNAEFEAKRKPKLPKAGSPPAYQARGASGKYEVDPTTDDLGAFKRALFTP